MFRILLIEPHKYFVYPPGEAFFLYVLGGLIVFLFLSLFGFCLVATTA